MNNAIDKIRKKKTKYKDQENTFSEFEDTLGFTSDDINMEEYVAGFLDSDKSPEELLLMEERNKGLRKHLSNVQGKKGVEYKVFLDLRYFQEKSYEEIAEELNIPIGTVKANLFRAKELLEKKLSKDKYFS